MLHHIVDVTCQHVITLQLAGSLHFQRRMRDTGERIDKIDKSWQMDVNDHAKGKSINVLRFFFFGAQAPHHHSLQRWFDNRSESSTIPWDNWDTSGSGIRTGCTSKVTKDY